MKNIVWLAAFLLILAGILYSCGKKNEDEICICILNCDYPSCDTQLGKWRLEFITCSQAITDYAHYNIVYEFKENHILTVSGKGNIDNYRIHNDGRHFYKNCLLEGNNSSVRSNPSFFVIDGTRYGLLKGTWGDSSPLMVLSFSRWNNRGNLIVSYVKYFSVTN